MSAAGASSPSQALPSSTCRRFDVSLRTSEDERGDLDVRLSTAQKLATLLWRPLAELMRGIQIRARGLGTAITHLEAITRSSIEPVRQRTCPTSPRFSDQAATVWRSTPLLRHQQLIERRGHTRCPSRGRAESSRSLRQSAGAYVLCWGEHT